MAWKQKRSLNGDAMVFDSIEIFVSFPFVWDVCVTTKCKMTMWQKSYQVKWVRWKSRSAMAKGWASMQISSVIWLSYEGGCLRFVFRSLSRIGVQENLLRNVLKEAKILSKGWFWWLIRGCHGLGYFWILLAISWPRICWDTFGNIMA